MQNEKRGVMDMAEAIPPKEAAHEVVFESEEKAIYSNQPRNTMTKKVIKHSFGFIKNERQANVVLIIFAGILFYATLLLIVDANNGAGDKNSKDAVKAAMERMRSK